MLAMLKVAAALAQTVQPTERNAPLAEMIISGAQAAINALASVTNQAIDPGKLAPIAPIGQ